MGADTTIQELGVLLAVPRQIEINGATLQLTPFTFEELYRVAEIGRPLFDLLTQADGTLLNNMTGLLRDHAAAVVSLTAALARVERGQVARLSIGQLIKLFNACIEVNADFFTDGLTGWRTLATTLGWLPEKSTSAPPSSPPQNPVQSPSNDGSTAGSDSPRT